MYCSLLLQLTDAGLQQGFDRQSTLSLVVMVSMMAAVISVFGYILISCRSAVQETPFFHLGKRTAGIICTALPILLLIGLFILAVATMTVTKPNQQKPPALASDASSRAI